MKQLKIFIVLIFILSITQGCIDNKGITKPNNMNSPSIDISKTDDILNLYNFSIEEETVLPSFVKLLKNRYGIELKIHDIDEPTGMSDIAELDGLLFCYADSISENMQDKAEKYYTLNDFLKNSEVLNLLPEQYRKSLEDENGDIWSLPTQQVFFLDRRVYDETIMDSHNLSVPSTVEELMKLLHSVREIYTNDSAVKFLTVTPGNCLWELKDILEFYGLTVFGTEDDNGIIGWNEETQRFEDTIYNLDADSLFDTIDYMQSNLLYDIVEDDFDIAMNDTGVFTKMKKTNRKLKYMTEPFYEHKEYIFSYSSNSIFVPLGTTNPKETLNLFVDTFFGSNEGNIYGYHGESGRTVTYDDSFTQVNFLASNQVVLNEDGSIYFIGLVGPWLTNDYVFCSSKLDVETNERNNRERSDFNKLLLQKLETDRIEVLAQYKNLYINSNLENSQFNGFFNSMFFRYLNEDIDRDTFIEEYVTEMKKIGFEEFINEKNETINAETMFYYD